LIGPTVTPGSSPTSTATGTSPTVVPTLTAGADPASWVPVLPDAPSRFGCVVVVVGGEVVVVVPSRRGSVTEVPPRFGVVVLVLPDRLVPTMLSSSRPPERSRAVVPGVAVEAVVLAPSAGGV